MNNFKNAAFIFLAIWILVFQLSSCKTAQSSVTTTQENENALLWEITGKDIQQPSYIFGTIHLINSHDFFFPKGTLAAIDASDKIIFEIDMKDMTDITVIMGLMDKLFMKDDLTLSDLLNEDDYKLVSSYFEKMSMPMMMLERMKPMFLSALTNGDMDMMSGNDSKIKSYEMELMSIAEQSGKETGGLETIEFQLSIFDEIPYEAQAKMLVDAVKGANEGNNELDELTKIYLTQDITAMANMITSDTTGLDSYEDILLVKRNQNWIPKIIESSKKQPVFYAVGAGHLGGKNGVINLLKKEGLTLRPLSGH